MKKLLTLVAAFVFHSAAAEEAPAPDPFAESEELRIRVYPEVSKIDLDVHHSVKDAIEQILAGLPPEDRKSIVLDIPIEEFGKMPMQKSLRLGRIELPYLLKHLEGVSPIGYRFWNNEWHLGKERADDIITVKYHLSKTWLNQLGVAIGPSQTFSTKNGKKMWPPDSVWSATFTQLDPVPEKKQINAEPLKHWPDRGILKLKASRRFHEEVSAVLLLQKLGYETLTLDR